MLSPFSVIFPAFQVTITLSSPYITWTILAQSDSVGQSLSSALSALSAETDH